MKVHLNIAKKNDKSLHDALDAYIKSHKKLSREFLKKRLKAIWLEQMGPTINSYTKSISYSKGTLFIHLTSAPLRQDLSMSKSKIIDLFNAQLGAQVIDKVMIK